MSYTETLVEFVLRDECPGCGPTLSSMESNFLQGPNFINKYCTCCGWAVSGRLVADTLVDPSFGSLPDAPGETTFLCTLTHPEHRANWPQPQRDMAQPDKYSQIELLQEVIREHPEHYYIIDATEKCSLCKKWAAHKISEERKDYTYHPYSAALCCDCFERVFGPFSHQYDKVYAPITTYDIS